MPMENMHKASKVSTTTHNYKTTQKRSERDNSIVLVHINGTS